MSRDKEHWARLSREKFDADNILWSQVVAQAPRVLDIPPYYSNPSANRAAGFCLDQQTSAALYWALKYKLDNDQTAGLRATTYLSCWTGTMSEARGAESRFAFLVKGNKFIQAAMYLQDFDWNVERFKVWIDYLYKPAAIDYAGHKNNQGAWGWLGFLRARRLRGVDVRGYVSEVQCHFKQAVNAEGVMIYEILRTNSGMWYTNFALEAYIQIAFDYLFLDGINIFDMFTETLDWYFQYCLNPQSWPWKLSTNFFLRWIQKMRGCADELELPYSYD